MHTCNVPFLLILDSKSSKPKKLIYIIEKVAKEERIAFEKEQGKNQEQLAEMQRLHEEAIQNQLAENKRKKLKLGDYMMCEGNPTIPTPESEKK